MKKIHDKVYFVLKTWESTRNYDKDLYRRYMEYFHPDTISFSKKRDKYYLDMDSFSITLVNTITRCRRMIQNTHNKFLPTSATVRKERRIKESMFRAYSQEGAMSSAHP